MNLVQFYNKYFQPGIISTDSRNVKPGDIFIALQGENFDGNQYAESAIKSGAKIAVIDAENLNNPSFYKVDDTLLFLQNLANYHRKQTDFHVIGLTGTNGKTTTKELLLEVLKQKFKTHATPGNLNNHIGVPLTLLSAPKETEICIVEMGANHPGEIASLCTIAEPDCGLITNIGLAHLEGFGDFEGVKRTKAELYQFLKKNKGKIYYNASDQVLAELINGYQNSTEYNSENGLTAKIINSLPSLSLELGGKTGEHIRIDTQLFGEYNLLNILASASVGLKLGLNLSQIRAGIEQYRPTNYRSQLVKLESTLIILDCYNANPSSMTLALRDFSRLAQNKKIAILGGMKELGGFSAEEHRKIVELTTELKLENVLLIGEEFLGLKSENTQQFNTIENAKIYLDQLDLSNSSILIKGSRANQLESLANFIKLKFE